MTFRLDGFACLPILLASRSLDVQRVIGVGTTIVMRLPILPDLLDLSNSSAVQLTTVQQLRQERFATECFGLSVFISPELTRSEATMQSFPE